MLVACGTLSKIKGLRKEGEGALGIRVYSIVAARSVCSAAHDNFLCYQLETRLVQF